MKRSALCWLLLQAAAVVTALDWESMTVVGKLCTFDVRVANLSGNAHSQFLHKAALRSAFSAAADRWPSSRTLRAAVRYKPLAAGVTSVAKPRFVALDKETRIQSAALASGGGGDDVVVDLNQHITWHLPVGNGSVPVRAFDLATVVLQEIYHCLMLSGNLRADADGKGGWLRGGAATRFDRFVVDDRRCAVVGREKPAMGKALTSGALTFWMPGDAPAIPLHAPAAFGASSVYHLRPAAAGPWRLLEPGVPAGVKRRTPGKQLIDMQRAFLDLSVEGAPACTYARDNPNGGAGNSVGKTHGRITSVGGMPLWVFGICVVLLVILIFFVTCALCTVGAVAKQKAQPSCWKSFFPWCCTGVEVVPDELYYVSPELAERLSQDARSSNISLRRSVERLRRSCDLTPAAPDSVYSP